MTYVLPARGGRASDHMDMQDRASHRAPPPRSATGCTRGVNEHHVRIVTLAAFWAMEAVQQASEAVVRAINDVVCYCVERKVFQQLFGSLQEILDEEAARRDAEAEAPPPPPCSLQLATCYLPRRKFELVTLYSPPLRAAAPE